jgi:hypothetical protein
MNSDKLIKSALSISSTDNQNCKTKDRTMNDMSANRSSTD